MRRRLGNPTFPCPIVTSLHGARSPRSTLSPSSFSLPPGCVFFLIRGCEPLFQITSQPLEYVELPIFSIVYPDMGPLIGDLPFQAPLRQTTLSSALVGSNRFPPQIKFWPRLRFSPPSNLERFSLFLSLMIFHSLFLVIVFALFTPWR